MILRSVWLAAGLALATSASAWAGELRAGAAKFDITPPAEVFPYDNGREAKFVGVHDPLFARALVFEDSGKRVLLVSIDVITVPRAERTVARIAEAAGVPASQVIVAATHSHNVPLFSYHRGTPTAAQEREMDRVEQGAVSAVRAAVTMLQPARIASARGAGWININNGEQAGRTDGYDPLGVSDKTLDVVRIESAAGAPLALLVNYPSHAEVMFKAITRDGGIEVSGDLPGAVSALLEGPEGAKYGAAPVVLFTAGAEGDQLPQYRAIEQAGVYPARDYGAAAWTMLDAQARKLALSVGEVLKSMPASNTVTSIAAASGGASCPGQKIVQNRETGAITREPQPPVTIPLTLLRIGNISFAGIGADVASEIGIALRRVMPKQRVLVTMTAGSVGYVLADASYERPGHGAFGSPIKPGCAQTALIKAFSQLSRQAQR